MKVFLLHADRDADLDRAPPPSEADLTQDLELDTLLDAMGNGDELVRGVARRTLLAGLTDPGEIEYRQNVLADCLEHREVVRELYGLAVEAIESERKVYLGLLGDSPDGLLRRSDTVMTEFVDVLRRVRQLADDHAASFSSVGFRRFFSMLRSELGGDYFDEVEAHLKALQFRRGTLLSAELGRGNQGVRYVLRAPRDLGWRERLAGGGRSGYSFHIPPRDENGFRALSELRGRGIALAALALARSADHILDFFTVLRAELAFYIGCLALHQRLAAKGEPVCTPVPVTAGEPVLTASGLYDPCLSLTLEGRVVGNDVAADGSRLVLVTGANQGGKSTFLRSVGVAQLMLQAGMFVAADSFRADVREGVFTHFEREEDAELESGKLDEELRRMSSIVDSIRGGSLLLCNESFASTNEREGSEIARQIVGALVEAGVKVVFVTHLYDLAHGFYAAGGSSTRFLRAERGPDGRRTYKLSEGEPLPTSYGADAYRRVFDGL